MTTHTEKRWTAGPWKLDANPSFHRNRVWTQDMRPIVSLLSMGPSPADIDPEAQANARLIAASPELYEELERSARALEALAEELAATLPRSAKAIARRAEAARAALTKAREG